MIKKINQELSKVIIGQQGLIEEILIALVSRGHVILVGVPGLAKTLLIKSIAQIFKINFNRVQFTPDLMPSDLIGYEILEENRGKRSMKFLKGPLFSNMILADEINRTPPKTQSALLQAMQEKQISVMGTTYSLDEPFFVLATQNPIEFEGTYPLPEAQLDRFMFMLLADYPNLDEEIQISTQNWENNLKKIQSIFSQKELINFQTQAEKVAVAPSVVRWVVTMVQATRPDSEFAPDIVKNFVRYGAGPRASQYIISAAKSCAFLEGKKEVLRHHIEKIIYPVLRHRIFLNFSGESEQIDINKLIDSLLKIKLK